MFYGESVTLVDLDKINAEISQYEMRCEMELLDADEEYHNWLDSMWEKFGNE